MKIESFQQNPLLRAAAKGRIKSIFKLKFGLEMS